MSLPHNTMDSASLAAPGTRSTRRARLLRIGVVRWALTATWMAVIFLFSAQTGGDSAGLSARLVSAISPTLPQVPPEALTAALRKSAHVGEYAILGALLTWAWRAWPHRLPPGANVRGRHAVGPVLAGITYATSDEFHQLFVPGRAGQVTDVGFDSIGVIIGVGIVLVASRRRSTGSSPSPSRASTQTPESRSD